MHFDQSQLSSKSFAKSWLQQQRDLGFIVALSHFVIVSAAEQY